MNVQKNKDLQKIKISCKITDFTIKSLLIARNISISKKGMYLVRKINLMNGLHYQMKKNYTTKLLHTWKDDFYTD